MKRIEAITWTQPEHNLLCMHCTEPATNQVSFSGEFAGWMIFLCETCSNLPETELIQIIKGG